MAADVEKVPRRGLFGGAVCRVKYFQLVPLPKDLLARLSPATVQIRDQLLPSKAEVFPKGEARDAAAGTGLTVSLYPGATRSGLSRVLAVLLLFVIVRNNVASPASMRRLAMGAVANGVLLALFGLIQFFTSPSGLVYWSYQTRGWFWAVY